MLLDILLNMIIFFNTLGILIIVHECGHFFIARFFKVKVERFSIGFGPVLWSKMDSYGTEYTVSMILLGGYVKLCDTSTMKIVDYHQNFNNLFCNQYFWKKILIIISGPVFNFIFAIFLYVIVFMVGVSSYKPIINYILPNSIVAQCNIPVGSKIKCINEVQVTDWESVRLQILNNINAEKITIFTELFHPDCIVSKTNVVFFPKNWFNESNLISKDPIIMLGIFPNFFRVTSLVAEKKLYFFDHQDDLQIGDKILLINGQPIYSWESFFNIVKRNLNKKFSLMLERNQYILYLNCNLIENCLHDSVKIQKKLDIFCSTIVIESTIPSEMYQYGLYTAILKSCDKVWNCICSMFHMLLGLMSGDVNIINLHGPLEIAKIVGQTMHYGIIYYLMFLAIISINLGMINLIPLPILDGGHLLLILIEKIQGHPILPKTQNFIYTMSFIILMIIMCITLYNDITS